MTRSCEFARGEKGICNYVGRFAEKAGINAGLLRNYINGFKKPSKEREQQVLQQIHQLGQEFVAVEF